MRLDRLHLVGFGKFADKVLEFGPGLNLIFGENEGGKSTVLNFLRGMLFGLKKPGNRRSFEEILERYRPWDTDRYYGVLEYTLDGRIYRIERNFEPRDEKVRVLDGATWEDLTAGFEMDKRREVLFAQEHLGISQTIFDNTVCIRQLQTRSSANLAGEIQAKLVNLVSAGEEDISIKNALQALDTALKDLGQTERSGKSSLGKASAKVEEMERARQKTLEVYAEIRSAETNRQALVGELLALNRRYQELMNEVKALEANETETKLAKIREYDRQIEDQEESLREDLLRFPLAEKENLILARDRENLACARIQDFGAKVENLASRLDVERQAASNFAVFAGFGLEGVLALEKGFTKLEETSLQAEGLEKRRRELTERWRLLKEQSAALEGCAQLGAAGEAEVNALEEQINKLTLDLSPYDIERLRLSETNLQRRVWTRTFLSAAALVLGVGVGFGLGIAVRPLFALAGLGGLIIAILLWLRNRQDKRRLGNVRQEIEITGQWFSAVEKDLEIKKKRLTGFLAGAGAGSVRELTEKMRQLALVEQRQQALLVELVELDDGLAKLRQRVGEEVRGLENSYLAPAGILRAGQGLVSRDHLETFSNGVNNYLSFKAEERDLLRQLREFEEQKSIARTEALSARGEVERILRLAEVSSPEEFLLVWEDAVKLAEVRKSIQALKIARSEVLGNSSLEELEQTWEKLRLELGEYQPINSMPRRSMEEIRAELELVSRNIQDTKELIGNLQGIIDTRLQGVKNLAEIETGLMDAWREKQDLIQSKKALELARETIIQISREVQREFAPQVNRHIGQTIDSLTAGRYLSARIDQDLNLKVIVPETGEAQDIASLSLGTVDQFYFALRLALVDLIGVKFPLVMDEPFIQYDDKRLEAALQVLLDLASKRQVVLFSCHRRELNILNRIANKNCQVIHLNHNVGK